MAEPVSDHVYRMSALGPVMIHAWRNPATLDRLDVVEAEINALLAENPSGIGILVRVHPKCGVPGNKVRRRFAEFLRTYESDVHGIAVSLEGTGLWAATMRTVVSTVSMVAKVGPPMRVSGSASDAAEDIIAVLSAHGIASPLLRDLQAEANGLGFPGG